MKPTWGNPKRNVSQGGGFFPPFRGGAKNRQPILSRETLMKMNFLAAFCPSRGINKLGRK